MSDFPVKIITFSRRHVLANHRILFNVLNIFKTGHPPPDYISVCRQYTTDRFITAFHPTQHHVLELTPDDLQWMKRAQLLYAKTRKFPSEFSGDLHLTCDRHKPFMDRLLAISDKWFIRTEDFSLKKTVSGVGPYNSLERILPAMLSSDKSHPCLRQTDAKKTLYFMPWIEINKDKEFRVFVFDGRVTAISQQFFSEVNRWLAEKSEAELSEICRKIFVAHQTEFKGKLEYLGEKYVMDVALVGDEETPYFIEPNPFGAEYSSGSSLFHWIFDAEIIEGRAQFELRFVDKA